jgi:murein L,D-transpeptidase YcbB/YkuD
LVCRFAIYTPQAVDIPSTLLTVERHSRPHLESPSMRGLTFDRLIAGTALALILTVSGHSWASSEDAAKIEAAVPVPEAANVPPPTAADIAAATPAVTPAKPAEIPAPATTASTPPAAAPAPATAATPAPAPVTTAKPQETTAPAVASAPQMTGIDVAVSDKIRDLLTARADRYFSRKNEKGAVEAFYRDRGYAPFWTSQGAPSARAVQAIAYLRGIDADGMEPSDYPAPQFKAGDADALADAELKYTAEILEFTRHAMGGRVHYSRVSGDIGYELDTPDATGVLSRLSGNETAAAVLDSYQPQHEYYKKLKAKLAEARGKTTDSGPKRIDNGPILKLGKSPHGVDWVEDERVPQLRARLGLPANPGNLYYDRALAKAVADFQAKHAIKPTGELNMATVAALNGPRRDRDADIIAANLERWRWAPHELGKTYVMVNIPDFSLRITRDNKPYWTTRIVTGKPSQPTPITTASMKFITVNPTWNVPPSIIANEYLPAVRQDPTVLERMGLRMSQNPDGTVRIYQPPGDRNALGRIRFNFPNKFLVYQHDTPDKHLFAHDKRAYSHGCMRVQDPLMYGEKLLSIVLPQEKYTVEKLRGMFGGSEVNINFPAHLPVHLTYQTAFVDDSGNLVIREDIYGRDQRLIAIMKGDERKVADIPVERSHTGSGVNRDSLRYSVPGSDSMFGEWFSSRGFDRRAGGPQQPGQRPQNPFAGLFGGFFR